MALAPIPSTRARVVHDCDWTFLEVTLTRCDWRSREILLRHTSPTVQAPGVVWRRAAIRPGSCRVW
jgi:hypothetical protein